ncbi:MAG: hypothetical protein ACFFD4_39660 [Candidatus Odinarchaeota archaeon]
MSSIGTVLIFTSLAFTAIYFSFQNRKYNLLLVNKIQNLQTSLKARKISSDKYVEFTVNQEWFMKEILLESKEGMAVRIREFFSGTFGATILWVLVWMSSGLGLFIGVGLAFLNQETAVKIAAVPIVIIFTYIAVVYLSEIFTTFKYVRYMQSVNDELLVAKDLVVMIRVSYILMIRLRQFLVIAVLLFMYGIVGVVIDEIIVSAIAVPSILFLAVFGSIAGIIGDNPALGRLLNILVIASAFVSVIIAIAIINIYIKFWKFLIRVKVPAKYQPSNVLEFQVNENLRPRFLFGVKSAGEKQVKVKND